MLLKHGSFDFRLKYTMVVDDLEPRVSRDCFWLGLQLLLRLSKSRPYRMHESSTWFQGSGCVSEFASCPTSLYLETRRGVKSLDSKNFGAKHRYHDRGSKHLPSSRAETH